MKDGTSAHDQEARADGDRGWLGLAAMGVGVLLALGPLTWAPDARLAGEPWIGVWVGLGVLAGAASLFRTREGARPRGWDRLLVGLAAGCGALIMLGSGTGPDRGELPMDLEARSELAPVTFLALGAWLVVAAIGSGAVLGAQVQFGRALVGGLVGAMLVSVSLASILGHLAFWAGPSWAGRTGLWRELESLGMLFWGGQLLRRTWTRLETQPEWRYGLLPLVSVALLATVTVFGGAALSSANRASQGRLHANEVLLLLSGLREDLSGLRGELGGSREPDSLEALAARLNEQMEKIRRMTADNAVQRQAIAELERVRTEWETWRRDVTGSSGKRSLTPAEAAKGQSLFTEAMAILQRMGQEERRLVQLRNQALQFSGREAAWMLFSGGTVALGLVVVGAWVLRREMLRRLQSDTELQSMHALRRAILNSSNYAFVSVDPQGLVTTFNQSAETLLGYPAAEVVGKVTPILWHEFQEVESRAAELTRELGRPISPGFECFIAKARLGQVDEREWTFVRRDGQRRTVWLSATALRDDHGRITGYLGVISDLTERKKTEAETRRMLAIIEQSPEFIGIADLEGRLRYLNPAASQLLGGGLRADGTGLNLGELQPEWATRKVREEGLPQVLATGLWEGETALRRGEGPEIPVRQMLLLHRNHEGQPEALSTIMRDDTALRDREARRSALLRINQTLSESTGLAEAAGQILAALGQSLGWSVGGVWSVDAGGKLLVPVASWSDSPARYVEFLEATRENQFAFGVGLPGRVWQSGAGVWIADLAAESPEVYPRATAARSVGLRGAFAFPIALGGRILGVVDLFGTTTRAPSLEDQELFASIGVQLGQCLERWQARESLATSEALLRQFIKHSPAAVAMLDTQVRYLQASDRWIADYGLDGTNLLGRSHYDVFPDLPSRWKEIHRRVLDGVVERCEEDAFERADGSVEWLQWECQPWRKASGEIGGIIFFTQVITARKLAEAQLARTTERLRVATVGAGVGVWEWNARDDTLVWDDNMFRLYRVRPEEFAGNLAAWTPSIWEEDSERVLLELRTALAGGTAFDTSFRIRHPDGTVRYIRAHGVVDGAVPPQRVIGTNWDITEQRKAEEALRADIEQRMRTEEQLRQSEEQFRQAINYSAIGMALVNLDGQWLQVNKTLCDIVGYSQEELLGRTFQEITHPDDLESDLANVRKILAGELSYYHMEKRYRHKDQRLVWVLLSVALVRKVDGTPLYFVSQVQDITSRKHSEEQIAASLREKEVLLKEIHHRVKNNMQVISSILSLQARYVSDGATRALFEECRGRVQSMALIHEKLYRAPDLATIDFGVHIRELAQMLLVSYREVSGRVRLETAVESVALDIDTAIPVGLILNELLTNALKYGFPAGRAGVIRVEFAQTNLHHLTLRVKDDGVGLPPDFKIGASASLGLKMIAGLTRQIDGELSFAGEGGADFRICFPRVRDLESTPL
ncbi:MAG: PAS domain S-box protein [Verrucomicrobia bacterium]|nr:PAS domain S-box protein [Verrucomicrobiota bacterium]